MKERPHVLPAVVAFIILLVAVAPLPYEYYQFLRWVICGASIYIAYKAVEWSRQWAVWLFVPVAILFNPLLPIHLTKEIWQYIDLATALSFGLSLLYLKNPVDASITLDLRMNNISDISALSGLTNLEKLYLSGNPLSPKAIDIHIPELEARGVDVDH
jgi:hypothetical protein